MGLSPPFFSCKGILDGRTPGSKVFPSLGPGSTRPPASCPASAADRCVVLLMDIVRHLFAFPVEVWRKWTGALPVVPSRAACAATTPPDRLLAPAATETTAGQHQSLEKRAKRRCVEALPVGVARWWIEHAQEQAVARLFCDLLDSQWGWPHHGIARFASFNSGDATATAASASSVVAAVAGCMDHWPFARRSSTSPRGCSEPRARLSLTLPCSSLPFLTAASTFLAALHA